MTQGQRYLMFLKKDEAGIVIDAKNASDWENVKQEAESKGMTCLPLAIENFYPDYRGYRYFDLRNPVTLETFSLDYVLDSWEADKRHRDGHEGTEEGFIH
jgi:hypothetical protein